MKIRRNFCCKKGFTATGDHSRHVMKNTATIGIAALLAGGGAQNPTLVREITREIGHAMPGVRVLRFDDKFFDSEAKEAVAFALLGYLHLTNRPGNLPSATGARGARILGVLTPAS